MKFLVHKEDFLVPEGVTVEQQARVVKVTCGDK